jgi:flagellum-specific peptidoglycan hydrolase FlgJ
MNYYLDSDLNLIPQPKKPWGKILIVLLMLLIVYLLMKLVTTTPTFKVVYKYIHPTEQQDIELSEEAIVKCLHDNGCVLANVAVAQARLESNLGKSNVGKQAKNMFGITHHKCKYVSGKHGVYAKYKTYEDNIKCYIHIQDRYLQNINGVYATDPTYITKIKEQQ